MVTKQTPKKEKVFTSLEEWKKEYRPKSYLKQKKKELSDHPKELADFLVDELKEKVSTKLSSAGWQK